MAPPVSTTTTTTTLPVPQPLSSTTPVGTYSGLGPIERVPVPVLAPGALVPRADQLLAPYAPGVVKLAFRQFGSGPDLLLVMGQHGTMTWWDPQLLNDLAGHFRVTVFDLPGTGYSAPLPGAPSVESYADATAGLIFGLQLHDPVVLGWGLGGTVALALAERHPGILQRLVLVDATAGGPTSIPTAMGTAAALASPSATLGALSQLIFPKEAVAAREGWVDRLLELSPDDIVASGIASEARVMSGLVRDASVSHSLHTLKIPVLLIAGSQDSIVPAANSTTIAASIPRHQLVMVPDAGYGALEQDEARLLANLVSFATGT